MPSAALAPALLMLAALLLLGGGCLVRLNRQAGPLCLLALLVSGGGLFHASRDAGPPAVEIVLDGFSLTVCWAALGLGLLLTLPSMQIERRGNAAPETWAGLLLALSGLMLAGMAADLIVLLLALELIAVPTFLSWVAGPFRPAAHEAAARQVLLGLLSTALSWFGLALLYGLSGTTNLADCLQVIASGQSSIEPATLIGATPQFGLPAIVLLLAGIAMRVPLVPFHFSAPELAAAALPRHAAMSATIPKLAGLVALWQLTGSSWGELDQSVSLLLLVVAAATMLLGAGMANVQETLPRMLAWTTLAHGGFALMGVAVGAAAGLFYLAGYALSVAGLFAAIGYLSHGDRPIEYLDDLNGLGRSEPVAAGCLLVCLLNLAGLPPLPLFWGNLFLTTSALAAPTAAEQAPLALMNGGYAALALLAAISSLLLAAVYLKVVAAMFLQIQIGRLRPAGGRAALAAAVLAALLTLGAGLLPAPLLEHLERIVR